MIEEGVREYFWGGAIKRGKKNGSRNITIVFQSRAKEKEKGLYRVRRPNIRKDTKNRLAALEV